MRQVYGVAGAGLSGDIEAAAEVGGATSPRPVARKAAAYCGFGSVRFATFHQDHSR
jgi:hypothetical protein